MKNFENAVLNEVEMNMVAGGFVVSGSQKQHKQGDKTGSQWNNEKPSDNSGNWNSGSQWDNKNPNSNTSYWNHGFQWDSNKSNGKPNDWGNGTYSNNGNS